MTMRKYIAPTLAACITALVVAGLVWAQPGIGITKTAPISGTGSSGSPLKITVCANGESYVSNGTSWSCSAASSGDITGVTAGSGMTGTATSGNASLDVGCGVGLTCGADSVTIDPTYTQRRVGGTCSPGQAVGTINDDGSVTCNSSGAGDIEGVTAGTNMDGGGTSGTVTVDLEPTVSLAGEANTDTLDVANTATGQTTNPMGIDVDLTGTVDGNVTEHIYAVDINNATGCVGCNGDAIVHWNYGMRIRTSGANFNTGLWVDTGTTSLDEAVTMGSALQVDGAITSNAAVTLGNDTGDQTTVSGDLAVNDDTNLSAGTTTVGDLRGTALSPATISGTVNDWSPTSIATATVIRVDSTGSVQLTGLSGGAAGRMITLVNISSSYTLSIYNDNGGSTAANRFYLGGNPALAYQTLGLHGAITFIYDGSASRWQAIAVTDDIAPDFSVENNLAVAAFASLHGAITELGNADDDVTQLRGMVKDTSTAATLSGCGTSPTITGGSNAFVITAGTGGITACTATFASTKTNAPACIATIRDVAEGVYLSSVSATAITITARTGTTDISSNVIDVICIGDA